jgi:hypothetical protein
MAIPSLYRRILGPRFDSLPRVLQTFHDAPSGGRARGTFQVERGSGLFRNALASVMGLPGAGKDVAVRLEVRVQGDRERWLRHFPRRTLVSTQWADGSLLLERVGLISFACALAVEGSRVGYEFRRAWLVGIPLPTWLSPYVDGRVDAADTGWRVSVHVYAPFFGQILQYQGWVEPE